MRTPAEPGFARRGFTLVEVIIALVILGIGIIALLRLFPTGVQRSVQSERLTRATFLSQEILEAIKTQGGAGLVSVIPSTTISTGSGGATATVSELVPMPGDGVDDDEDGFFGGVARPDIDFNGNGTLDGDYDGMPEPEFAGRYCRSGERRCLSSYDGLDNDLDGVIDDDGDSGACGSTWTAERPGFPSEQVFPLPDGDLNYDPEVLYSGGVWIGVDEEFSNGIDDDGQGIDLNGDGTDDIVIDEDVRLAANFRNEDGVWFPLDAGDGIDNDWDGEPGSPLDPDGRAIADGVDNNGDGRIDEGIDEEKFDGGAWGFGDADDDGDGRYDEDCRAASYPFMPRKFFRRQYLDDDGDGEIDEDPIDGLDNDGDGRVDEDPLNDDTDQFAWQIIVGRVPDGGGDGINNDGDRRTDEEIRDGLNDDPLCAGGDLLVDEDCEASPVRGFRRVTIRITWNGDGDQSQDERPGIANYDDDGDGVNDFRDPEVELGMLLDAAILGIPAAQATQHPLLQERWAADDDEDGRIDEEKLNGLDDDFDGRIDEDVHTGEFYLTGFIRL